MIDTGPNLGSRNTVGSGMIKLVWNESATSVPCRSSIRIDPDVEVGEGQTTVGDVSGVTGFILPGLEVHDFATADAEQHAQNFQVRDFLGQTRDTSCCRLAR